MSPLLRVNRWLILAAIAALTGCGFHLSRPPDLPFETLYIDAPNYSSVAADLKRYLASMGVNQKVGDATGTLTEV